MIIKSLLVFFPAGLNFIYFSPDWTICRIIANWRQNGQKYAVLTLYAPSNTSIFVP